MLQGFSVISKSFLSMTLTVSVAENKFMLIATFYTANPVSYNKTNI
jgi:hypothetical protein